MFRGIFNKRRAEFKGERDERELLVVPSETSPDSADESLLLLSRELSSLNDLPVSAAAKERGWATLQREMERRPIQAASKSARVAGGLSAPVAGRAGSSGGAHSARPRGLRWGLASAAGVVAVVAALLGAYSGGLLPTAGNGDGPGPGTSVVSADTTQPHTTQPDTTSSATAPPDMTLTTVGPVTTAPGVSSDTTSTDPAVTDGTVTTEDTTEGTQPTTPVTTRPTTPATTSGPATTVGPSTTQPTQITSPTEQQMAAAQRESSAESAARRLADLVITGNTSGARALVASDAQKSLVQMIMSLTEPYGSKITGSEVLDSDTVRVTMEIKDRVVNNVGEVMQVTKRFAVRVQVEGDDAVIIAINAD